MNSALNHYQDKNILITGGLGFIGSNLARALAAVPGARITVLDSLAEGAGGNRHNIAGIESRLEVCVEDMTERERMNELVRKRDCIFNLAGQVSHIDSMNNPFSDAHSNHLAHLSLLEACRHHNTGAKVVFTSTRQVYGKIEQLPVRENHPLRPVDINGIHKLAAEQCHRMYHDVYGVRSAVLRLTNTYGPCQEMTELRQGILPLFIRRAMDGDEIQLFGDGQQERDLNYVDDVVDALLLVGASQMPAWTLFNLGAPRAYSLQHIVETLLKITGKGSFRFVEFPEERKRIDIGNALLDFSTFHKHFGWEPKIGLEEGLRKTVEFYERNRAWYWS